MEEIINKQSVTTLHDVINAPEKDINTSNGPAPEMKLDPKPMDEPESATINVKDSGFFKKYAAKKTVEANENVNPSSGLNPSINDKEDISQAYDKEDFDFLADSGIDILDILMTTLLRWIAKDTQDSPYTLTKDKSEKLKKILAKMLSRVSVKMPLWAVFLIALIFSYITPFKKAISKRKDAPLDEAKKKQAVAPKVVERVKMEDVSTKEVKETFVEVKTEDMPPAKRPPFVKKGRGRPSK